MMKLSDLKKIINLYPEREDENCKVVIQIKLPYSTIGSIPCVDLKSASMGFDWDNGKFILFPEKELTFENTEFSNKMKDLQDKCGWLDYENRNLKAEIKKLKADKK